MTWRRIGLVMFLSVVWLWFAIPVHAHPLLQYPLVLRIFPDKLTLDFHLSARHPALTEKLQNPISEAQLRAAAEQHIPYLLDHFELRLKGQPLSGTGKFTDVLGIEDLNNDLEAVRLGYHLEYTLPKNQGFAPKDISLGQEQLKEFNYSAGQRWSVQFMVQTRDDKEQVLANQLLASWTITLLPVEEKMPASVPVPEKSRDHSKLEEVIPENARPTPTAAIGWMYLQEGMRHMLTGYDHLLFAGALILAAQSFWELFKVVLAFTLAHSLTLTLATLGWVHLPPWFVEPAIALSIIIVALENAFLPSQRSGKIRLGVAFGFGLIHGLGFAGGLLDSLKELPDFPLASALGAFSVGVELGHQLVILPLIGLLWLIRKHSAPEKFERGLKVATLAISAGGVYFLVIAVQTYISK